VCVVKSVWPRGLWTQLQQWSSRIARDETCTSSYQVLAHPPCSMSWHQRRFREHGKTMKRDTKLVLRRDGTVTHLLAMRQVYCARSRKSLIASPPPPRRLTVAQTRSSLSFATVKFRCSSASRGMCAALYDTAGPRSCCAGSCSSIC